MNKNILFCALIFLAGALQAAESNPKDDITAAATKLADKANYSWKTTIVVPESSPFRPGPTEGELEKDGITHITMSYGDNTTQVFMKGDKAAVTNPNGGWLSLAEMDQSEGPSRFIGMLIKNFKNPAAQAMELAAGAKALKQDSDVYSGDLTEAAAKALIMFRRATDGPAVSNAKGSVNVWIKDGLLAKYEFAVKGTMKFNDNEMEIDRTTTVEIKNVGTTKVTVPEEAKKKLT